MRRVQDAPIEVLELHLVPAEVLGGEFGGSGGDESRDQRGEARRGREASRFHGRTMMG